VLFVPVQQVLARDGLYRRVLRLAGEYALRRAENVLLRAGDLFGLVVAAADAALQLPFGEQELLLAESRMAQQVHETAKTSSKSPFRQLKLIVVSASAAPVSTLAARASSRSSS